jgi:hypothetical protein
MITAPLTGHLDAALTQYAKGFTQNGLIADLLAPRVPVGRQTDKYWIFGREGQQLTEQILRATGAPAQRTRLSLSTGSYFRRSHALKATSLTKTARATKPATSSRMRRRINMIEDPAQQRERAAATMLTDTAQVTNNTTLAGINQWSDYGNSDPVKDVRRRKALIAESPASRPTRWQSAIRSIAN